jgi:DNA-binding NtrC family response regulator
MSPADSFLRGPVLSGLYRAALAGDKPARAQWRTVVRGALRDAAGNVTAAAEALGISHKTLRRWIADTDVAEGVELRGAGRPPTAGGQ